MCVKPVITYGYFTISYNEARKTICGDNKNWILIQTCRGLECESEVSSQRRCFWCHNDISLGRWVDVPAMLVRTFAQAVLLPCFWVLWQESIDRISPIATVPHRRLLRKSGDGKFYIHHHQINLSSVCVCVTSEQMQNFKCRGPVDVWMARANEDPSMSSCKRTCNYPVYRQWQPAKPRTGP